MYSDYSFIAEYTPIKTIKVGTGTGSFFRVQVRMRVEVQSLVTQTQIIPSRHLWAFIPIPHTPPGGGGGVLRYICVGEVQRPFLDVKLMTYAFFLGRVKKN